MTNQEIVSRGQEVVMNTYGRFPIALVKGKGSYVWDADGKEYLDFVGGIAVCALGHSPAELQKIIKEQADNLWHVSNLYWIEPQVKLAEKLTGLSGLSQAFFCNSGAEANEAAIKLVRKYYYRQKENRSKIIVFNNSFHGRTLATLTATGQSKYQEGFAPLPEGFVYADFNDLMSVEKLIDEDTAAIMIEPIQGEGGVLPADPAFLAGLRHICNREGIFLVFDEVQCGVGRTGNFMAFQTYGISPDIVTMAKGLGGGFPIGAMLVNDKAASGFAPGDHASTFGGNPLATAVASQLVDIVSAPGFLENVNQMGGYLKQSLEQIKDERIVAVRSKGLMAGLEFHKPVNDLVRICMQNGLLLVGAGPQVLRFVPALNVNETEINQMVGLLKKSLKEW
ncbi:Aminotransferase class-III [Syntrophomonas zehnderi OL-4]|uniref:Acetylornithine aminotransferase n=1 Tax=Syntrophomonas zehnderi OL-4 TaxID=690567 RepID=A0A0E4GB65_9FIRM|nr:aspartate aminotransferase family protein [Syntrophomonas zehnderi]CFX05957.1 Aminotransferase class-III [Syntrophomonas zehnderi OL-4]CFX34057.1 Aminotransferase class-III [Syntrophomonas zehnderi OL-4]